MPRGSRPIRKPRRWRASTPVRTGCAGPARFKLPCMDLDAVELRVLGCLIEKQRTTPDQYPLSVNALRNACNQSTSRDPVVDWDETAVREGIQRLSHRGWIRLASGPGSRAAKYRHLLDSELSLDDAELAVLAVLMLRGPQTAAEISQR